MKEHLEHWATEDRKKLLALVPTFHGVFARTKDTYALDIARNIGITTSKLKP